MICCKALGLKGLGFFGSYDLQGLQGLGFDCSWLTGLLFRALAFQV